MTLFKSFNRAVAFGLAGTLSLALADQASAADRGIRNLGSGLGQLVERELAAKAGRPVANRADLALAATDRAIRDDEGRVLVTILLKQQADRDSVLSTPSVKFVAEEMNYRGGAIEAYVAPEHVAALAEKASAVHMVIAPFLNVGLTTSQGVRQHRVDQISNQAVSPVTGLTGAGITIGVMSDTFNTVLPSPKLTTAPADVLSGDLPGPGNPNNPNPVRILDDPASGTDEGRGMAQIIHDIAPKANMAYATAFGGEVSFANNIRRLAAPVTNDPATTGGGCHVIVDDVLQATEGMFADTLVARAADDVAAAGVHYFSSSGNRPATMGYFSTFRPVFSSGGNTAADNVALTNTNINLAGVPPSLYAGGFHDFNPAGGAAGLDVAQLCAIGSTAIWDFQWDDPYDVNPITKGPPFASGTLTIPPAGNAEFTFNGTANQFVQISVFGSGSTPNFDAIVRVTAPDGTVLVEQDTGAEEDVNLNLEQTGTYTVRVTQFGTQTGGQVDYTVSNILSGGKTLVTTDFNILFFKADGTFFGAVGEDNIGSNRPIEVASITNSQAGGTGQLQVVIARSNVPPASPQPATKLRYVTITSGEPIEYFSYQSLTTWGHNCAAGAMGVAAYAFYPPFHPEGFTSNGPTYIAFDKNNNRLPQPEVRLKPDIAAMDGANTTFFGGDSAADADSFPNFFGTSAAAPHAAAIAALVLEAKGGPTSVTPNQMRTMLQRSAFPHDLDPNRATATLRAGSSRVTVALESIQNTNRGINDPNNFSVNYAGPGSLTQLVFNPQGTAATAGNTTEPIGNSPPDNSGTSAPGVVFDTRTPPSPGLPFTLGVLRGVVAADINAVTANPAPPPAADPANQRYTLAVNINFGQLIGGEGFNFGIERDEADAYGAGNTVGGDSADLFGAMVLIPSGQIAPGGMTVGAANSVGGNFSGVFVNRIGAGWASNDGFGFINAQSAVNQPIPQ